MFIKHWWIVVIRENITYSEKNPSQCHLVHHKSHVKGTIIESGAPQCGASDYNSEVRQGRESFQLF